MVKRFLASLHNKFPPSIMPISLDLVDHTTSKVETANNYLADKTQNIVG